MIPLVAPAFFSQWPKWTGPLVNSGITLASLFAVALNAFFNGVGSTRKAEVALRTAAGAAGDV